jgi:uncharacterized membrane protein
MRMHTWRAWSVTTDVRRHISAIDISWLREMLPSWRAILRRARFFLPNLPPLEPMPRGPMRYIGLGATILALIGFFAVFFSYIFQLHQTLGTHAEDLGIMDQVLWNTAHGHFWHETICNPISDSNCLGDASRWGIHFEPLMLTLVPLYLVIPGPHTLQFVQVAGVALGALPAYWLGSRRFQHVAGGVLVAVGYLLMPVLRAAVVDDFHMVTLAAPLLMLALYFLYARNDWGLIITCILAMGTKEQVPLDVFMIGMAVLLLQRRWRLGLMIMAMAVAWAVMALGVIHLMSPLGASPTAGRYAGIAGTLQRLLLIPSDPARNAYLHTLMNNTLQLGFLAPWMVLLAAPSALLNVLSSDPHQYAGIYQYNADIAPFLVVAAMEGVIFVRFAIRWACFWMRRGLQLPRAYLPFLRNLLAMLFVCWAILNVPAIPQIYLLNPNEPPAADAQNVWQNVWPQETPHLLEAAGFFRQIPANVAVTAQADLVPHLSERRYIYQFPDGVTQSQYVLLDVESDYYPEPTELDYDNDVRPLLQSGAFSLVEAKDGYLLLRRNQSGAMSNPITLPSSFCSLQPQANADYITGMHILGNCGTSAGPPGS